MGRTFASLVTSAILSVADAKNFSQSEKKKGESGFCTTKGGILQLDSQQGPFLGNHKLEPISSNVVNEVGDAGNTWN